jgi:serine/threonine-protein kinase
MELGPAAGARPGLDGIDLQALVERFGPLPAERVVHVLRQVAASLAEAHARGLVHRDIKPANVYLCRQGLEVDFAKVLDFGLVKRTAAKAGEPHLTQEGQISGTPMYMAPEVARGDGPLDGRVDVYALGCVAWWLLAGKTVFPGDTAMKQILAHVGDAPEPPSKHAAVPKALDELVLRCLEKSPSERFADAGALATALAAVPLEHPWTEDQAREWWAAHLPLAGEKPPSGPDSYAPTERLETPLRY